MAKFAQLESGSRYGRLIITEESVGVRSAVPAIVPGRHWLVHRDDIIGVSSHRGLYGRDLLFHTSDGRRFRAERVEPKKALPVIQLLGHMRMTVPESAPPARARRPARKAKYRCQQGKLVISAETVRVKPRFLIPTRRHWRVPRRAVSGVGSVRRLGLRMTHDLTIYTTDGRTLHATGLSAESAIGVARSLGHVFAAPRMPEPVLAARAALWLANADPTELAREVPLEDGEMATARGGSRGWRHAVFARERGASVRFATLAALFLLCVYISAVVGGGGTLMRDATYGQRVAPPKPLIAPASAPPQEGISAAAAGVTAGGAPVSGVAPQLSAPPAPVATP